MTVRTIRDEGLGVAFAIDDRFADVGFARDEDLPTAHFIASAPADRWIAALAIVARCARSRCRPTSGSRGQLARARGLVRRSWSPEAHEMSGGARGGFARPGARPSTVRYRLSGRRRRRTGRRLQDAAASDPRVARRALDGARRGAPVAAGHGAHGAAAGAVGRGAGGARAPFLVARARLTGPRRRGASAARAAGGLRCTLPAGRRRLRGVRDEDSARPSHSARPAGVRRRCTGGARFAGRPHPRAHVGFVRGHQRRRRPGRRRPDR